MKWEKINIQRVENGFVITASNETEVSARAMVLERLKNECRRTHQMTEEKHCKLNPKRSRCWNCPDWDWELEEEEKKQTVANDKTNAGENTQ